MLPSRMQQIECYQACTYAITWPRCSNASATLAAQIIVALDPSANTVLTRRDVMAFLTEVAMEIVVVIDIGQILMAVALLAQLLR